MNTIWVLCPAKQEGWVLCPAKQKGCNKCYSSTIFLNLEKKALFLKYYLLGQWLQPVLSYEFFWYEMIPKYSDGMYEAKGPPTINSG